MSSSALRAAWEAAQQSGPGEDLRKAWEKAQTEPAPISAARESAKRFAAPDAEPASYAQQALGGIASLGRFVAGDAQAVARAMTRDRGVLDFAKEIKNTKGSDVLGAMKYGPLGLASLSSDAMKRTPSYARAQEDIGLAEESAGDVGKVNSGVGAALGLAPLAGPVAGLARSALSGPGPALARDAALSFVPGFGRAARGRLAGKAVSGLRGLLAEAGKAAPAAGPSVPTAEGFLGNEMGNVAEAVKAQRSAPVGHVIEAVKAAPTRRAAFQSRAIETLEPHRPSSVGGPPEHGQALPRSMTPLGWHEAEQAASSDMTATLRRLLNKATALNAEQGIHETGATFGDAEEAMGLAPHQQPDLESLLRRSIKLRGGIPRTNP